MAQETRFTQGPWKAIALGGASTVVADSMPKRNDARCHVAYGYEVDGKYCIGYPVLGGDGGEHGLVTPRLDYVHFSHADAHLIAAAPDMYEAIDPDALVQCACLLEDAGHDIAAHSLRKLADEQRVAKAKARGEL